MNKKKILIICLIICFICSLQAVSSADVDVNGANDEILATDNDVVNETNDLLVQATPESNDVLSEGEGSFSDLQTDISTGGTVELTKNYTYDSSSDSGLTQGIPISGSITINGNGNVIIDAKNQARIFNVASGSTLTLTGITFINANAGTLNGGAIYSSGTIHVDNCKFINNTANRGGALYLEGRDGTITNSVFEENKAAINGGAIRVEGSNWRVEKSTFNNNAAVDGRGGAIYLEESKNTTIDRCNFTDNFANINGGAVEWYIYAEDGQLLNSIFTNNIANRSGGAVYWYGDTGIIKNVSFTGNKALGNVMAPSSYGDNTTGGDGGAIMWTGINGIIDDSTFTDNYASQRGGAVFLQGSVEGDCVNTTFSSCTFISNEAGLNGGAIDWHEGAIDGLVTMSVFKDNYANANGGAIFWDGHNGGILHSNFTNNTAKGLIADANGNMGDGGAIIWSGINGTVDDCRFIDNNASQRGGGVFLQNCTHGNCTNTSFSHVYFENNYAGVNGGAIDWHNGAQDGYVEYGVFVNNTANRSGGAVFWFGTRGKILHSNFTGNKALGNVLYNNSFGNMTYGGHGGAIMWTGADGVIDDCTFDENYAKVNGGAIFMQGSTQGDCRNVTVSNGVFNDNFAGVNGGAVDWYKGARYCTLENATFNNNIANRSGGAVFWFGYHGTIRNATFTNNSALGNVMYENSFGVNTTGGHGGAIMWTGADGIIDGCTFDENKAKVNGGAIFMQGSTMGNCSNVTVSNGVFNDNFAGVNGGAVDWYKGAHDCTLENATFTNNMANRSGGAVFWWGSHGTIKNASFTNNSALGNVMYENSFGVNTTGGHGGAIMWTGADGIIDGCTFDENKAKVNGGAIFMQGSTDGNCSNVTVSNGVFNDNFAGVNGGAVDWYKGARYCTLENATFNNNIANRSGGAVFWYGYHGTIKNASFTNNQALGLVNASSSYGYNTTGGDGGAIMWTGSDGIIDGCNFTDNYAAARGGAVFLQGSLEGNCTNVTVSNSNFEKNKAETNGGAVNFFRGAVNGRILNSTFNANEAITGIGGAVVWRGYNGTIDTATFNDNTAYAADAGAVFIEGDSCKLLNTEFDSNLAGDDGGAVYWTGNYGKLYNLTATNNRGVSYGTSHSKGGTIIITGSNMTVDLVDVSYGFAEVEGGGLFLTGNNVNITNVQFYDCYVNDDTAENIGGALDIIGNNTRLINATIQGSSARYGGAIDWAGNDGYACNITVNNNHATEDGAALRIIGDRFEIDDSVFNDNEAGDDGGAIYWSGNDGIARNLTFYNNKGISLGDSSSNGGTMAIIGSNILIEDSSFEKSTADIAGGAIFVTGNNVNITGSSFEECSVSMDKVVTDKDYTTGGGAIYILGNDTHIMNCTFDNTHGREGGVIYVHGNNAVIDNATTSNSYALNGGTFYIEGVNAIVSNSEIRSSHVTGAGGAIYINGQHASILNTTVDDTYAQNSAYDDTNLGGAVYINGAYTTIDGSTFSNSHARNGGIIYLVGNYCNIINSTLTSGYAERHGGSIYCRGSYCTVEDSNISENIANWNGGAIYWDGGSNSVGNTMLRTLFVGNVAYANTGSKTRGGGALYFSEGGKRAVIKDCQFINDSVQTTNNVEAEGGAILWDYSYDGLIDNCTFDGCFLTSTMPGSAWIQGGAIYLRSHNFTFNNCVFANCWSIKEAGALYLSNTQGTIIYPYDILINNTKFINNTAKSDADYSDRTQGGGAIQAKECYNVVVMNSDFINNTANRGGAYVLTTIKNNGNYLQNCTFEGNTALYDGGSILSTQYLPLYNVTISDSVAGRYGGGAYLTNLPAYSDLVFINNTAQRGGGLYWDQNNINVKDMVFINNTATEDGGAAYITKGTATITNDTFINNTAGRYGGALYIGAGVNPLTDLNFTGNKAFSGSAIYASTDVKLVNVYLIENQANSSSLTFDKYDESTGEIVLLFKGYDNYLNGIYLSSGRRLTCTNVTFWDVGGVNNTGDTAVQLPQMAAAPAPEAGQNITVEVFDDAGNVLNPTNKYFITDKDGKIYLNLHTLIPDVPEEQYEQTYTEAILNHDEYYTIIKLTTRAASQIDATANKTTYHSNSTISVNVTHGATGNVSIYLNDTFLGNISLNNSEGSLNISTLIEGKYLPVGNYTLNVIYNGNAKYDKSNTTAVLEINKITPVILVDVTPIGYNLLVNVTVMDGEYGIADATGEVTVQVGDRTAIIYLGNSQGMTIIYGLPIGNYTVNTTYGGDHNYYNATNSTNATILEKTHTVLVLDVDSERLYFINETVPIKVTVLPEAEGNITLYINGVPHVLPLQKVDNSTFVEFNATELLDGINYVFATYAGTDLYESSWAEGLFHVIKYNATVEIDTANITVGDTEVINITLPEDATGILNVTVNGTAHYVEIINGTATLPLSGLSIGVYNVTVTFNGDKKYYNATNSTLFNVTKATPSIVVSVENITYGENATVIVTIPDGAVGNVTIKLNENIIFTEEPIDGKASFIIENLKAGNYTIVAIFNGNENYTVNSNSTKFTVFKATPIVDVTVEDIYYGDAEHITITVNTNGTVTVKVAGAETTLNITTEGNETFVYDLAVGNYPVEFTFNGNENYTNLTVVKNFNVYKANTTLDVQVQNITVWDMESINVTLADNATGNVTININGVDHIVPITNGTAQLNLTDLTVGLKTVWVFYDGDRNYTANKTMVKFNVGQRTPEINITAQNITVGEDGNITVKVPTNATGYVIIEIIGENTYFKNITNGQAVVYPQNLKVGNYTVKATYYGISTDNYTVNTAEANFTVKPIEDYNITVIANNITYGENATVIVTLPSDATGNVTIYIDGVNRGTVNITNGIATLTDIAGLEAGQHEVNVTYNGNERYASKDKNGTIFHVLPTDDWTLDLDVEAHKYGEDTIITVTLPENAKENVTLEIDGVNYTVKLTNGVGELRLNNLSAGLHEVNAYYPGDENYTNKTSSDKFIIDQVTPTIIINATTAKVGENATINITVSGNATGNVTIYVDGQMFERTLNNHTVSLNVADLASGNHNVVVFYKGDQNYTSNINSTSLSIIKDSSGLTIVAAPESVVVGKNTTITVTMAGNETGNVIIEVNGVNYTVAINDGIAVLNVTLPVGDYTAKAYYLENDKYNASNNVSNAFHVVDKTVAWVNITAETIVEIDNNLTFTVTTNSNATLVVKVNGVEITPVEGVYSFNGTLAGNYTITAEVAENDYYTAATNSTVFTVIKHNSTVAIDVGAVYEIESDFNIIITNNTAVVVTINGKEYPVEDGKVVVDTTELAEGHYIVTATIAENDKYYANSTTKEFDIIRHNATIESVAVPTVDVVVGQNATITVTMGNVTSGSVIIEVGGHNYTVAITDKVASLNVTLPVGDYTAKAYFLGDDKYNPVNATSIEFSVVNKTAATVIITADNIIEIDNNLTFTVTTNSNSTLIVKVNGVVVTPVEGVYSFNGTVAGNYTITAEVAENDYYTAATNSTVFTVIKHNSTVAIDVDAVYEIESDFTIGITNNTAVVVTINGKEYAVADGKVVVDTTELAEGHYIVTATIAENDKYYANATTKEFDIIKHNATIESVAVPTIDVGVGKNATITVTMGNVTSGSVIIEVGGHNYTVAITDKVAVLNVTLPIGDYTAKAYYLGDDKYNPVNATSDEFSVKDKEIPTIIIDAPEIIEVDNNIIFTVTNSTPVNVTVNGVTVELKDGKYTYNATVAGTATIIARSAETDEYYEGFNSTTVTVIKHNSTVSIDEIPGHFVGDEFNITITNNTSVVVTINGKEYAVEDGKVVVDTTALPAGEYTVTATVYENDKYYGNSSTVSFNITKRASSVNITVGPEYYVGDVFNITIENNTAVNVTINGKSYLIDTNGNIIIDTTKLPAGEYIVSASVAENDKYFANATSKTFNIVKKASDMTVVAAPESVVVGKNTTITVTMANNETGSLIIEVNGVNYTVAIKDHVAQLNVTLPAGDYTAKAYYSGDDYYNATNSTGNAFHVVDKTVAWVNITADASVEIDNNITFTVTTNSNATLVVKVNGVEITPVDGVYTFNGTVAGNYTITAEVAENDYYTAAENSTAFIVYKHASEIESVVVTPITAVDGQNTTITVTMANAETGSVLIEVNGLNYTVPINEGVATLTVTLPVGDYTAKVYYPGDDKYNDTNAQSDAFHVINKTTATVIITADNIIEIDNNLTFTVTTNSNATLVVKVNGVEVVKGADDKYRFNGTVAGNYTITAEVAENDYYTAATNSTVFTVIKHNSTVAIDVGSLYEIESDFTITITNNTAVVVTINGKEYAVVGGKVNVNTAELPAGHYIVTATIAENDKYYANSTTKEFDIIKHNATIESVAVPGVDVVVGQNATITVTMGNVTSGSVIIEVGGHNYTVPIVDNVAQLNVTLPVGTYTAKAYFTGDDKYNPVNATSAEFNVVNKTAATVIITADSIIEIDNNLTFTVTTNSNATLVVKVNGVEITPVDGVYSFNGTVAGNYTITAEVAENDYYTQASNSTMFTVIKHNSTVKVDEVPGHYVGDDFEITLTNNTAAVVTINGKEYAVEDGKVVIDTTKLPAGEYTVTATVYENDKYYGNSSTVSFNITKRASSVNVTADPINVNETAVIDITGPSDFNGTAIVNVDGMNYSVALTNGVGQLRINGLANGTYDINVTYLENDKYLQSVNDTVKLLVNKVADTEISASAENITVGDPAVIKVTVPEDATGNVTVTIGNITRTVPIAGGENEIIVPGVPVGDYDVKVTYNGDDKYLPANTTTPLSVKPAETDPADIKVVDQGNGTVVVVVPKDATGNVTITINGTNYTAPVVNGTATFDLTNETPGTYDITATYSGDENYTGAAANGTVTIPKHATPMSIEVNATVVGNVTKVIVTVPENVTGNVTVEIDGKTYSVKPVDGKAVFEIEGLTVGNKTVVASYAGDDSYLANSTTAQFTVDKVASSVNVTGDVIKVDETATIVIEGPSDFNGTAVVTIDGKDYSVNVTNGAGQLKVDGLANGTYDVKVTLLETDKYLSSSNDTAKVLVNKVADAEISASAEDITVGDPAVIKVTVPEDATGNVTVTIGNITRTVPITGGENEIIVPGVPVGEHEVKVTYNGDDKYLPANTTTSLTVKPAETSPDDIKVIDQGNGTVVVVVPANATGNVTITVDGNNYTAPVVNGTATFDLTDVAPGTYDVTATYSGDENHTAQSTDGKVTIPKYSTPMSIEVGDGKVGETIEVTVNVPENATGKVTIEVNGQTYTKEIADGKAVFEVTGLLSGNKTVTATYDGDDSYIANSTTANFTVNKNPAPISVEVDNSTAGQAKITVTLPEDATGYVIVNVYGRDYGINLTDGDKSVTVPIQGSGEYVAIVTYLGDEKYLENSTEKDFNASSSKVPPNIAAEVENVPVGEDVQVKVTIPEGGDGNVTVTVDNKTVTVPVTGGENIITIPGVSEGTHDVNISYSGNDQYEPQEITKSVTVFRSINAENITRGWNSPYDYKAEFLDKTGHVLENTEVQFIVNGKTYTVKTDSQGIAYLDTSKLDVGKYDVTIINPVTGEQTTRTTTIVKRLLENKDITMDFRDGTYYTVLAIGDDGKPVGEGEFVDIYVNTIHYSCRTDKDGYARLQLNLNPKTYTITAEYKLTKVSNKLVIKQTLKLVKKTVKVKKGKKLVLKAKLKWSNGKAIKGKKIVFKFKGKKYTAKTNSKGIAKVTIKKKVTKKLKAGKKYKYSATYVSNIVKGKVKVKK